MPSTYGGTARSEPPRGGGADAAPARRLRRGVRCRCKHKAAEHDPGHPKRRCKRVVGGKPCACSGFDSPWVCNCDEGWAQHRTVFAEVEVRAVLSEEAAASMSPEERAALEGMLSLPPAHTATLTLKDVARGQDP
mmetsp:Transcript_8240/g.27999  ORF Transcript_8240/g.27999 Transcript_8240/m.27999 type:complete len:135 (+) Transcript_8240:268-672(+)